MANYCQNQITVTASAKIRRLIRKHALRGNLLEFMLPPGSKTPREDRSRRYGSRWVADFQFIESAADGAITFLCDSAWQPPLTALMRFSARKGVEEVECLYFEPGCCFAGVATAKDGHLSDDSQTCDSSCWQNVPVEVQDAFGLESFYAEDEEEAEVA